MDKLLTTDEVADLLNVGPDWVRRQCQAKKLPHIKLGEHDQAPIRVKPKQLEAFLDALVVEAENTKLTNPVLARIGRGKRQAS